MASYHPAPQLVWSVHPHAAKSSVGGHPRHPTPSLVHTGHPMLTRPSHVHPHSRIVAAKSGAVIHGPLHVSRANHRVIRV